MVYSHRRCSMRLDPERIEAVDDAMADVLRRKTGAERLAIASGLYKSVHYMLKCHLQAEHPDWDESRISREAAQRLSHGAA